jgi:hypothetical protein
VLVASRIEIKKRAGNGNPEPPQEFELHDAITSVNLAANSFVVRGTTVTFDADTRFQRGDVTDLRVGAGVQVQGVVSGGNTLRAARIKFDK